MEKSGPITRPRKGIPVLSIVLAVILVVTGIIAAIEYQEISNLNSQNNSLNNQITSLQSQITTKTATVAQLQNEVNSIQSQLNQTTSQLNSANSQLNSYENIAGLNSEKTVVNDQTINQPASSYTYYNLSANYAGYIDVYVQTASSTNTYVTVIWSVDGVSYSNTQTVGDQGSAHFVVLPTYPIKVEIGNTDLVNGNSVTLSIYYYY